MPIFVSWMIQPDAFALYAFSLNWSKFNGYTFPPFALIARCLAKVRKEKAELVLVLSTMVHPTLVSSSVESGLRHSPNLSLPVGSSRLELRCSSSANNQQFIDTIRLEIVRGRLIGEGSSEDVVHLLLESNRESTTKDSVVFSNDGVSFSLSRLRKTQRSGGFKSSNLRRINDPLIYPVEWLGHYVSF